MTSAMPVSFSDAEHQSINALWPVLNYTVYCL